MTAYSSSSYGVDPTRAPRPILLEGKAPIRLQGRKAPADRGRLAALFAEAAQWTPRARRFLPRPELPREHGRPDPNFIVRSGVQLPVDEAANWRPLSERGVAVLADALNNSPLREVLLRWCSRLGIRDINTFDRRGFNRSHHARLVWQGVIRDHHAESYYNVTSEIERLDREPGPLLPAYGGTSPHERSHGESFVDLVTHRFGARPVPAG
jgi:hypothetical protein